MIKYKLCYRNGSSKILFFKNKKELLDFVSKFIDLDDLSNLLRLTDPNICNAATLACITPLENKRVILKKFFSIRGFKITPEKKKNNLVRDMITIAVSVLLASQVKNIKN
ncbi:MAG: hypothetical protein FWE18_00260 [Alphaproteobacteria bacterium]|nr:hypothetical protein [Alphaproteobacteria bacterium]